VKSVVFFNNKGGVGKTTFTCNVVSFLNLHKSKCVLLIDADPQCNATQALLRDDRHHQIGQPARALDDHRVGVALVALSAGQYLELLVSSALREWGQALKTDWDCGRGAQVTHCAVAFA
jgi:cellulose biosynthesis protein BcsQ